MQSLKTLSLAAVAACAALVTNDAQANPLLGFGSAANGTVSYVAAPIARYNCANGVCRPVSYGAGGVQSVPTGTCSGPNCSSGQTVPYGYCSGPNCSASQTTPYGYVPSTYAPNSTSSCPGGTCGQPAYGYGYRYGYPAGVSYYGWPVVNSVTPAAPVYAAPTPSQPVVNGPTVPDQKESDNNKPAEPVTNAGTNTSSPFYP